METVLWCPGAALGVLGSNNANIPIRTFYVKKYFISSRRGLHVSKEFRKQWGHKPFALSASAQDRGFFGGNNYDDDERVPEDSTLSLGGDDSDFHIAENTRVTIFNKTEAPLEETNFQVMLEILGKGTGEDRPGVDLVTVLDVGSYPWGNAARKDRIAKLKIAMQFIVNKLSPIDRLSVVRFARFSSRLCPLGLITEKSKPKLIADIINKVDDDFALNWAGSDILGGLQAGLKVLTDRRYTTGRVPAIMLMSGGDQNISNFPVIDVPVHTVGVGQGYNPKVLQAIARNSMGGTFSVVEKDNLSKAFSQCLAGLLTVAVQDLTITVTEKSSTIDKVSADDYPQKIVPGSVTVTFGNLYNRELRRITVDLRLPAVNLPEDTSQVGADVLAITYTFYRADKLTTFNSAPTTLNVTREGKPLVREKELNRLQTVGDERSRTHG